MPVTKAKKSEILTKLNEKFAKAKAIYFSKNLGLPVKKVGDLRKKLHKEGIELMVAKKTLFKVSAKQNNLPELPNEMMEGPVSAAFSYGDAVAPARVLYEFSKENENLQLLGGVVDGKLVTKAEAKELALLPSREVLLAKLVGSMKAPISDFHGVLVGVLRKFVYGLKAVQEKKGKEPAAQVEAATPPLSGAPEASAPAITTAAPEEPTPPPLSGAPAAA